MSRKKDIEGQKLMWMDSDDPPYQKHSPTSKEAAEKIKPATESMRGRIYKAIKHAKRDGLTDAEIEEATDICGSTVRPRRIELLNGGFIKASKQRRKTPSNRWAIVWII